MLCHSIPLQVTLSYLKYAYISIFQLKDLQLQLDVKECQEKNFEGAKSTKKFCKSVRKEQIEKANMDTFKDLAEAEEELERVKIEFEKEIESMKFEKMRLQEELRSLKLVNIENLSVKEGSVSSGILTVSRSPSLSNPADVSTHSPNTINENEIVEYSPKLKNKNDGENLQDSSEPKNENENFENSPQHESENENFEDSPQPENENENRKFQNFQEPENENENFEESPRPVNDSENELFEDSPQPAEDEEESTEDSPLFEVEEFRAKFESQTVENSPVAAFIPKSPVRISHKQFEAVIYHDSTILTTKAVSRSCISLLASKYRDENDPKASLAASSTRSSVADEFSQRMQRDQRFKKIREVCTETAAKLQDIPLSDVIIRHGVIRSPLSPLREDKNSPVKIREMITENVKNGFPKKDYSSKDKENSPKLHEVEKEKENSPKKEFWEKSSSQRKDFWEKDVVKEASNDVIIQKEFWENNNNQRKEFWEKQKQPTVVIKDVFQEKDVSWEATLRGNTDRSKTALNTSAVRDRIVYWEKENSTVKEPEHSEKDICWEKSLRCTDSAQKNAVLTAFRFDTSPQRAMSPLTRLGKLIDIPLSQLAQHVEAPLPMSSSKPLLPARPPVLSPNPPPPVATFQPQRAVQAKVQIPAVYAQSVFVPSPTPRVQGISTNSAAPPMKVPAPSRAAPTRTIANIPIQPTIKGLVPKVTVAPLARSASLRSAAPSYHAPVERAPSPPSRPGVASLRSAAPSYHAPVERAPSPPSRPASARILAIETACAAMPPPLRAPSARIALTRTLCPLHPITIDTLCPRVPSIRVDMHGAPVAPIFSMVPVHSDPAPAALMPPKAVEGEEACVTPRTRAKCVSARNVISARIDHKV